MQNSNTPNTLAKFDSFDIYTVDVPYLKKLHDADSEVYYSSEKRPDGTYNYDKKPFLGIVVSLGNYKYFIPLTSAKKTHKDMAFVGKYVFLIYEKISEQKAAARSGDKYIVKQDGSDYYHIVSALDLKKMVPVPDGLYKKIDIYAQQMPYRALLELEYRFCRKIQDDILALVDKLYFRQKRNGKVIEFCCDFSKLETICDAHGAPANSGDDG